MSAQYAGVADPGLAGNNVPKETPGSQSPASTVSTQIPRSKGVLVVDHELCSGCMQCVHTCSLVKFGVGSHELSRIKMAAVNKYIFDAYAQPCLQCVKPRCLLNCPTQAIIVDKVTGARVIEDNLCDGCQTCINSCPFTPPRISFDKLRNKAIKCDLCEGDPACVKACPTGALLYRTKPDEAKTGQAQS
jgi:Fe-S-cluster-containing dehydrogenase component